MGSRTEPLGWRAVMPAAGALLLTHPRLLRLGSALGILILWQLAAWIWPSTLLPTPAVVVDGLVVHAGGIPTREKIAGWLERAGTAPRCCG